MDLEKQDQEPKQKPPKFKLYLYILKLSMYTNIIYLSPNYTKLQKVHLVYFVGLSGILTIAAYIATLWYADTFQEKMYSMIFIGNGIIFWLRTVINCWKGDMFRKCWDNALLYSDNPEVHEIVDHLILNHLIHLYIPIFIMAIVLHFYSISLVLTGIRPRGDPVTLVFWQKLPWDVTTVKGYTGAITFQFCGGMVVLFAIIGYNTHQLIHYAILRAHLTILVRRLRSFGEVITEEQLMSFFHYHRNITKIARDFIPTVECTITMSICTCFTACIFTSITIAMYPTDYVNNVKMVFIFGVSIFFANQCYVGEYLLDMHEEFLLELYSTAWFQQSIAFKKRFFMVMMLIDQPFTIRFFGKYILSYTLFVSVMQKVYMAIRFVSLMGTKN